MVLPVAVDAVEAAGDVLYDVHVQLHHLGTHPRRIYPRSYCLHPRSYCLNPRSYCLHPHLHLHCFSHCFCFNSVRKHARSNTLDSTPGSSYAGTNNNPPNSSSTLADLTPLKTGWLLKKRELWKTWQGRYFILYPGKLAYYTDLQQPTPKAVIELNSHTVIYAAKQCTINGNSDHWYLM